MIKGTLVTVAVSALLILTSSPVVAEEDYHSVPMTNEPPETSISDCQGLAVMDGEYRTKNSFGITFTTIIMEVSIEYNCSDGSPHIIGATKAGECKARTNYDIHECKEVTDWPDMGASCKAFAGHGHYQRTNGAYEHKLFLALQVCNDGTTSCPVKSEGNPPSDPELRFCEAEHFVLL